ncbi:MAG: MFS transporter small subunit [Methylococcales bacterium]
MPKSKSFNPLEVFLLFLFWLYVSIPLAWGVWSTLQKAFTLFQ